MRHIALQAGNFPDWRMVVERHGGKLFVIESKEYTAELSQRPAAHNHENELPARPVLVFDLHNTLTPDLGYPLIADPFPGVKAFMDRMVGRNCCIHVMSASLDRSDPQVRDVRTTLVWAWIKCYGLPVSFVGPNVEANVRLDDRGVTIPLTPDWGAIGKQAEKRLMDTWILGDDGTYVKREDLAPVGDEIDFPDIDDVPDDQPRGYSTPMLDIDIHRTLNPGWGATREAPPDPNGVRAIQGLYDQGYGIQMSCAGWMLSTHSKQESLARLAAFRAYLRRNSIPYDRIVTKDDSDLFFDDKVVQFTTWRQALPLVANALRAQAVSIPSASLPGSAYERSESASMRAELAELKALITAQPERKIEAPPVNVTVNLPENMVNVAPPNLTIAEGAIKTSIHNEPQSGDLEIKFPGGQKTTVRRIS